MFKVKKVADRTPPWKTDFLVVSDDDHESILYEKNTLASRSKVGILFVLATGL